MSEDHTKLTFSISQYSQETGDSIKNILRPYTIENGCANIGVSNKGADFIINLEFCSFSENILEQMMLELLQIGAEGLVCTTWFDTVGEEIVFSLFDNKLQTFESLEALNDYKNEIANPSKAQFDYGKERNNKTAIIRLQIKGKGKRRKIADQFNSAFELKSESDLSNFSADFKQLTKSRWYDTKWCGFKWKDKKTWAEGPDNLIYGLKFIIEEDVFIYLGFDLEGLDLHGDRSRDSDLFHLTLLLSSLDGVSKTWIKFRPGANTIKELYIYHPGMGDEPTVLRRSLTDDTEWPK